MFACVIDSL